PSTGPTTPSGTSAMPSRKRTKCSRPWRQILSSSHVDRAFVTGKPRPYIPPPYSDHLGGGDAFLGADVGGEAAAVVANGGRAVGVERHDDLRDEAGPRLLEGVVEHAVEHVMQT